MISGNKAQLVERILKHADGSVARTFDEDMKDSSIVVGGISTVSTALKLQNFLQLIFLSTVSTALKLQNFLQLIFLSTVSTALKLQNFLQLIFLSTVSTTLKLQNFSQHNFREHFSQQIFISKFYTAL